MVVPSPSSMKRAFGGGEPRVVPVPVVPWEAWVHLANWEKVINSTSRFLNVSPLGREKCVCPDPQRLVGPGSGTSLTLPNYISQSQLHTAIANITSASKIQPCLWPPIFTYNGSELAPRHQPRFKSWLCSLPTVWPQANCLTSLCLLLHL